LISNLHNLFLAIAESSRRARSLAQAIADGAAAQAAVGAGDDKFSADEFSDRDDALGSRFPGAR
jgi:hypothetical protein